MYLHFSSLGIWLFRGRFFPRVPTQTRSKQMLLPWIYSCSWSWFDFTEICSIRPSCIPLMENFFSMDCFRLLVNPKFLGSCDQGHLLGNDPWCAANRAVPRRWCIPWKVMSKCFGRCSSVSEASACRPPPWVVCHQRLGLQDMIVWALWAMSTTQEHGSSRHLAGWLMLVNSFSKLKGFSWQRVDSRCTN